MARIRTIKPEFWTSEQVMELSMTARLLFIGIWNFCDDAGNHNNSEKTIKAEVFPADDLNSTDIRRLLNELVSIGLLVEYEAGGKSYLHVTGWHHQKIDKPSYKFPAFQEQPEKRPQKPIKEDFDDRSPNGSRMVADHSLTEGRGMEGKGMDIKPPPPIARTNGEKFQMTEDWLPSENFRSIARQAGVELRDGDYLAEQLGEFRAYWLTQARSNTQLEWDYAFVKNLKVVKIRTQSRPPPQARAIPVSARQIQFMEKLFGSSSYGNDGQVIDVTHEIETASGGKDIPALGVEVRKSATG